MKLWPGTKLCREKAVDNFGCRYTSFKENKKTGKLEEEVIDFGAHWKKQYRYNYAIQIRQEAYNQRYQFLKVNAEVGLVLNMYKQLTPAPNYSKLQQMAEAYADAKMYTFLRRTKNFSELNYFDILEEELRPKKKKN